MCPAECPVLLNATNDLLSVAPWSLSFSVSSNHRLLVIHQHSVERGVSAFSRQERGLEMAGEGRKREIKRLEM